jgi:MoxR-like ATPase
MKYKKIFDPKPQQSAPGSEVADRSDGRVYVFDDDLTLAVNVALATRRPLLLRGATGTGKSSLAPAVAMHLRRRYLETVISSRTEAEHLLWHIDHLRRLRDAQANQLKPIAEYVMPGILWWALDPVSAEEQWKRAGGGPRYERETGAKATTKSAASRPAVVLLDEIDKADPDLPNNLLVPLGSLSFSVEPTGQPVSTEAEGAPLLIITSNDERDLPTAFLRRCIEHEIPPPKEDLLLKIAARHFPNLSGSLRKKALDTILDARPSDWRGRERPVPAEYLDALRAVEKLGSAKNATAVLQEIATLVIWKPSGNVGP